ncbi:Monothiol glutaredoxin-S14, chloroplastic [Trifolium repens]|nr:bifunctional monothiol glutaredoxin-S16, chloroplastic [Trifolium repens]WJX82870.1 Monothiol glutaredoxin-S14, chloroplastic [Trifolium repens]
MSFSSCVKPFPQLYLYPTTTSSCFHSHVSGTKTTTSSLSLPPRSSLLLKQNSIFHSQPKLQLKRASTTIRCSALTPELKTTLDKVVTSNKIVLFMKGTKDFPQCGFSNTVVQILKSLNAQFETVNILDNDLVRQGLKEYSNWPTFPQLYIDGEFFGGCDITVEAYKNGELQELVEKAMCS